MGDEEKSLILRTYKLGGKVMELASHFDKQEVKKEEEMVSQSKIKIGIKGYGAEVCSTKKIEFPVKKTEQR